MSSFCLDLYLLAREEKKELLEACQADFDSIDLANDTNRFLDRGIDANASNHVFIFCVQRLGYFRKMMARHPHILPWAMRLSLVKIVSGNLGTVDVRIIIFSGTCQHSSD